LVQTGAPVRSACRARSRRTGVVSGWARVWATGALAANVVGPK
jgi:hypothetical protein